MSPRGLIVDFGGVLTTSIFESFGAFCREHGIAPERLKQVLRGELDEEGRPDPTHPTNLIETGRLTGDEFNRYLARELSVDLPEPLDPQRLKDRLFFETRPEPAMVLAVSSLRSAGIPTALLSNSWGGDGYPRELFAEIFDAVVLSGEVGMRKPEPEIYRLAADRIGRDPADCVFVDDMRVNVVGAEAVGMTAILHRGPLRTIAELEGLFGLRLPEAAGER